MLMIFTQSAVIRSVNSDQSEVNTSLIEVFATIAAIPPTVEEDTTCRPKQLPRWSIFIDLAIFYQFSSVGFQVVRTKQVLLESFLKQNERLS